MSRALAMIFARYFSLAWPAFFAIARMMCDCVFDL